jgi:hypothetical protein
MQDVALLKAWQALVQRTIKDLRASLVYLPTSERRAIADQCGMDNWEEADEMIEQIEKGHTMDKDKHLKRLEAWTPPEDAKNLEEVIDAAVAFLRAHPDARLPFPLGLNMVADYLTARKKDPLG